jgi:hypothetical protein
VSLALQLRFISCDFVCVYYVFTFTIKVFYLKYFYNEREIVGGVGETISEVSMNPTCSLLDVESVHLQFGNNLSLENDVV